MKAVSAHIENQNYIFYLKLGKGLPPYILELVQRLHKWDITVVPVKPGELNQLTKSTRRRIVLTVAPDLMSYRNFLVARKNFIDFSLLRERFCLIDVTSFQPIDIQYKIKKLNNYFHYSLPVKMDMLAKKIATIYYNENEKISKWPGGKRSTLPRGM